MKRTTGSRKVVRAIALGLASMMLATSVPVTTYADEPSSSESSSESSESSESREITVENLIEECDNPASEADQSPEPVGAVQAINNAQTEVVEAACNNTVEVQNLLTEAAQKIDNAENTDDAKGKLEELQKLQSSLDTDEAKQLLNDFVSVVYKPAVDENGNPVMEQVYEEDLDENGQLQFDENGNIIYKPAVDENGNPVYKQAMMLEYVLNNAETDLSAAENSGNADVANTSSNETEARAAAASFDSDLNKVGQDLKDVEATVGELQEQYDKAEKDVAEAKKNLKANEQSLIELEEAIKNGAIGDTAASIKALEAAKKKVDDAVDAVGVKDYVKNEKEYEILSTLYTEYKSKAPNYSNKYDVVGDIFKALIRYYAVREDGYVDGSFQISGGITGHPELSKSDELIGYKKTVDGVTYNFPDVDPEGIEKGFAWDQPVPGLVTNPKDNWAMNAIVARYTIKNEKGEEVPVEKYYNVKIGGSENELWFYERTIVAHDTDGDKPGYIEWSKDPDGKTDECKDTTVVTDYMKYKELYPDLNRKLVEAQEAVNAAYENVCRLKERIEKLNLEKAALVQLERELGQAQERLSVAQNQKIELEKRYGILKETVIDLSRFDSSDEGGDNDDEGTTGGPSSGGYTGGYTAPSGITVVPVAAAADASGVAGARSGRRSSGGNSDRGVAGVRTDNKDTDLTKDSDAGKKVVNDTDNNTVKKAVKKIDNNKVPLADTPFEEGNNMNWALLFGLAAAAIVAFVTFESHRRKAVQAEEMKKYKK